MRLLIFEEFGRSNAESLGKLSDGAAVGIDLVVLDPDYGSNTNPSSDSQVLLS